MEKPYSFRGPVRRASSKSGAGRRPPGLQASSDAGVASASAAAEQRRSTKIPDRDDRTSSAGGRRSAAVLRITPLGARSCRTTRWASESRCLLPGVPRSPSPGFRRSNEPVRSVAGCAATDFGQTRDAAFGERIWAVGRALLRLPHYRALFEETDLIWARTLEMLATAVRGQALCSVAPPIVYESLDIHRLLLRQDLAGAALRDLEGRLGRSARLLVTSSPAFVSNYFATRSKLDLPVRLIENKVFIGKDDARTAARPRARPPGPPWVIGWFGHIRCKESLRILTDTVRRSAGKVEVVIRGRPALEALDDFERSIAQTPGMRFLGPYRNPEDLDTRSTARFILRGRSTCSSRV